MGKTQELLRTLDSPGWPRLVSESAPFRCSESRVSLHGVREQHGYRFTGTARDPDTRGFGARPALFRRAGVAHHRAAADEALRLLTTMTPLCERSEELFRSGSMLAGIRCEFCPLFYERGGQPEDVGCQGMLAPVIESVLDGDDHAAAVRVAAVVRTVEELLMLEESGFPDLR